MPLNSSKLSSDHMSTESIKYLRSYALVFGRDFDDRIGDVELNSGGAFFERQRDFRSYPVGRCRSRIFCSHSEKNIFSAHALNLSVTNKFAQQ